MSAPSFTYYSSVRRGLAAAITTPDDASVPGHVSLKAAAVTNVGAAAEIDVRLMGPGEVVGVDQRLLLRPFPRPGETSHPPHLFVALELDRAELPWLFTPAAASNDRLRPWLGLVVVKNIPENTITSDVKRPLPTLHVDDVKELPEPADAWAWAHVTVTGQLGDPDAVEGLIKSNPERVVARLFCPRRLEEASSYIAALVPLFETGRAAGSAEPVDDGADLSPAWQSTGSVDLPVYFSWDFSTGPVGDFRSLALMLKHAPPPPGAGSRPMDITHPGPSVLTTASTAVTATLGLEGAMRVPGAQPTAWDGTERAAFEQALTNLIDTANLATAGLGPPLYGRWLAARTTIPAVQPHWLRELNLDPRSRAAAGLGSHVVQEHHQQLMAQAWAQVGQIDRANRALRQAQLARAQLRTIHAGALPTASDGAFLQLTAPAHDRVLVLQATARGAIGQSSFPQATLGSAFRRVSRPRGRFGRRLGRSGVDPGQLVERLAAGTLSVAPPPGPPDGAPLDAPAAVRVSPTQIANTPGQVGWHPLDEGDPMPGGDRRPGPDAPDAGAFRQAAVDWATWLTNYERAPQPTQQPALDSAELRKSVAVSLDPNTTVAKRTRALVTVGNWNGAGDDLEPVMAAPRFPQPMWEPLRDLSQQYLLPGIGTLEPNSLTVAEPNPAFIEAYMVGLNHEIGRMLLFAEYPTDQRGTCFRQFWDPRGQVPAPAPGTTDDIDAIDGWSTDDLGRHLAQSDLDMLVLLVRGDLLHRYPDLTFYAAPAVWTGAVGTRSRAPDSDATKELYPIFRGTLAPDIVFVAFSPLNATRAKGASQQTVSTDPPGWFFVLQQPTGDAHHGLAAWSGRRQGTPSDPGAIAWDDFADAGGKLPDFAPTSIPNWWQLSWPAGKPKWGTEAAATAALTLQRPVRVAIHASELLP